jgi:hypothetical protein
MLSIVRNAQYCRQKLFSLSFQNRAKGELSSRYGSVSASSMNSCSMKNILEGKSDAYGGFIVDHNGISDIATCEEFERRLSSSLSVWRDRGVRGVWLKIPIGHSAFIPIAVHMGFEVRGVVVGSPSGAVLSLVVLFRCCVAALLRR